MAHEVHDYVVVGGGSAGSALAHRISADRRTRVLVLEAGAPEHRWDPITEMPAAMGMPVGNPRYDWCYTTEPEPHMQGRRMRQPRGRVLGGSSSINGMMYQRGHVLDYDDWARLTGDPGWDAAHCLPYFRRLEHVLGPDPDRVRGQGGPQVLDRGPADGPLYAAFLAAAAQAGHDVRPDLNDHRQEGFAPFDRMIFRGRRYSAARAYLDPARGRPNLQVRTGALITRILFDGTRAVGVEYRREGRTERVFCGEVVLTAGAMGTPQLLQLSGVGPAEHLRSLGVPVVADLPAVGSHLQDHLAVHVQHACAQPVSRAGIRDRHRWPTMAAEWLLRGQGMGASNHLEAGGFLRSGPDEDRPDLMFAFAPLAMRSEHDTTLPGHGYQMHVGVMRSAARGTVRVVSTDPTVAPEIRVNYLSGEGDLPRWTRAIARARELLSMPAFAALDAGEILPGVTVNTPEEIATWVSRAAQTGLHPSCTARMGRGPDSVVDPTDMRVHGLAGLRVADSSAMPRLGNANTYAPTMMLAERAADLILGNTPLPPETLRRDDRGPRPMSRSVHAVSPAPRSPVAGVVGAPG